MKRIVPVLMLAVSFSWLTASAQFAVPPLQAGVVINDTIAFQSYQFAGYCDSLGAPDVTISMGAGLAPLATGVELMYVVTACPQPPDTAFCLQTGVVQPGDTFSFPTSSSVYTIYSTPNAGGISFMLIIAGTPVVPFETYPCSLLTVITLADCANSMMTLDAGSPPCTVGDYSGQPEPRSAYDFTISPNPASSYFEIAAARPTSDEIEFRMYDIHGREVHVESLQPGFVSKMMDTDKLDEGLYLLKASHRQGLAFSGKVIIVRQE